jgi:hypothetical protein
VKYEAILNREFEEYLTTRTAFYRQEQRWPNSLFWRRRQDRFTNEPSDINAAMEVTSTEVELSQAVAV